MPFRAILTLATIILAWTTPVTARSLRTVTAANDFGRVESKVAGRLSTPYAVTP